MASSRRKSGSIRETFWTVVYAIAIAIVVRTFAFEPFNIPSGSMIPTLLVGDYLFVSKYSYGYSRHSLPFGLPLFEGRIFGHQPERGDVAVFKTPSDNRTDFIKRVIGLPGDHIRLDHGVLQINGKPVERKQIDDYVTTARTCGPGLSDDRSVIRVTRYIETLPGGMAHPIILCRGDDAGDETTDEFVVPPDHYFMMGDNRDDSADSRYFGYVPAENLVGRAEILFFSADGSAALWEVWKWPWAIRWSRFFGVID